MTTIRGVLSFISFILNTLFWGALILLLVPFKLIAPTRSVRQWMTERMVECGENWISINSAGLAVFQSIEWRVEGLENLQRDRSYLVCSNHRSWVDIVVLQKVFNRKIPFLRFFLKQQLIYVPVLGAAWWALDFPFMKRHTKEYLEKHPEKRGEDFESIRKAGQKFVGRPVSVLNFLEGTRFTIAKHRRQNSPFHHLLAPKAGGVSFVLEAMGQQFDSLLDVTITYPHADVSLWALLSGRIRQISVDVCKLPISSDLITGSYLNDTLKRERMQEWVRDLWAEKDKRIGLRTAQFESKVSQN